MAAARIVVIEDEDPIADAVAARLRSEGFEVEVARDGVAGVEVVQRARPDLVVLDLMLPGLDGLEVCRRIQRERPVPVVMLTARDDETDVLVGLGVGADDYITKPFSPRELVARIRTVLRRVERAGGVAVDSGEGSTTAAGVSGDQNGRLRLGPVEVDVARRRVRRNGDTVHLTPTEFDILHALAVRRGAVLTRDQLMAEVWGWRQASAVRTVDSHVRALRRKLGAGLIRTVHGVGYAVEVPSDPPGGTAAPREGTP